MNKSNDLLAGTIYGLTFKFLLSSILGTLAVSFYILFDTIFIGQALGGEGLAALNICLPVFTLLSSTGLLIGMGGGTLFSIALGTNDTLRAHKIFTTSLLLGLGLATCFSIIGLVYLEDLAYMLGATTEILPLVMGYMKYLFLFAPSFILVNILTVFMRNNNLPHIAMMSTIFSGVVNIILDALFLFPLGMGMEGAVLATCIASVLSLSILTYSIMRHPGELRLMKKPLSFVIIKEIFTVGLPTFIIEICSGIVIFLFNSVLLEQAGTMGVSAYGIIANIALMAMAVFNGIGQGIQPLISINYASNQMTRVHTIKRLALATATGVGILFYSVGYFMRDQLAGLFISNDTALLELASSAIPYYFIAFLLVGFNLIAGYYFQAVTRPRISIIISLSRGLLFILLGLVFLPKYLGMIGIWLVVPFAEAATLLGLGVFLLITSKRIALQ